MLGFDASRRLKSRVENLSDWLRCLEMVDLRLVQDGIPLREVVLLEGDGGCAKRLVAFSRALSQNPRFTAAQAWQASQKMSDLPEEKVLCACFSALGTGALEKRRIAIAQAQGQLRVIQAEADEKAKRDCKMYRGLGLAGGAALFLILL